jgi:hypothetical protein
MAKQQAESSQHILRHTREGMTAHYSMAQVLEIRAALELITDERHANNSRSLRSSPSGAQRESLLRSLLKEKRPRCLNHLSR